MKAPAGKREAAKRAKEAARREELQAPPRVAVFAGETKVGKALIGESNRELLALTKAHHLALANAEQLARRLGVDARPGSRAKITKRRDDPAAWDAVARAFAEADSARSSLEKFRAGERSRPDAVALEILNRAIEAAHLQIDAKAAPRVFDFVTALRNVVMAAQPGMSLNEMLAPFHVKGGGRPPKADASRIRNWRRWAEEEGLRDPVAETAYRTGVSRRTVARLAPKKKPKIQ